MSKWTGFLIVIALLLLVAMLTSCACNGGVTNMSDEWCEQHTKAQSWDQENLKRNDKGCPGSIYTAPNGELQLCPPM
jgi:hypothetical protein